MAKLKDRDETFCQEYLIDLNPYQAAIRTGYSPKTAKEAYRWLKENDEREKPRLRARVDELLAERSRRTGVTADRVIRELARVAFADITQIVDPATVRVRDGVSADDTAAIASIKIKDGDTFMEREVKLCDKLKALEHLGRHLGMFTDNIQLNTAPPTIIDDIAVEEGVHGTDTGSAD